MEFVREDLHRPKREGINLSRAGINGDGNVLLLNAKLNAVVVLDEDRPDLIHILQETGPVNKLPFTPDEFRLVLADLDAVVLSAQQNQALAAVHYTNTEEKDLGLVARYSRLRILREWLAQRARK